MKSSWIIGKLHWKYLNHSWASSTLSGPSQQLPWCDLAILWPFRPFPRVTTTPKSPMIVRCPQPCTHRLYNAFVWGGHGGIVFIWLKNSMQLGIQSWPCRVWQQVNQLTGSHGLWQRSTDGLWYSQRTHTRQEMDHLSDPLGTESPHMRFDQNQWPKVDLLEVASKCIKYTLSSGFSS